MKKIGLLISSFCLPFVMMAQGLQFETGTFQEALDKAKAENKLVFLDVYTTWCGPCKQMAANLFPAKEAGDVYNKHFVNYKIDAEKGEGISVASKYNVSGYPTNLFLRPDGSVVYKVMGAGDMKWFLDNADVADQESKDPMKWADYEKQLSAKSDAAFLKKYIIKGNRLGNNIDKGLEIYVTKFVSKKPTTEQLEFLLDNNQTMGNKAYAVLEKNKVEVNTLKKAEIDNYFKYYNESLLRGTIEKYAADKNEAGFNKDVLGYVNSNSKTPKSDTWYYTSEFFQMMGDKAKNEAYRLKKANEMTNMPLSEYQKEDALKLDETLAGVKRQMETKNVSEEEQKTYIENVKKQNPQILSMASLRAASELNDMAYNVYKTKNKALVKDAITWSKKSLELIGTTNLENFVAMNDTYAHLLYFDGQKSEAIKAQEKTVSLLKQSQDKDALEGQEVLLEKMKNDTL